MPDRAILLAGSTGLIGSHVASRLAGDPEIGRPVVTPARRTPDATFSGIVPVVADLSEPASDEALSETIRDASGGRVDAYISCLGTTMKKAGSREAFLAVDKGLVLRLARIARSLGASHAILVSSVGADPEAGNFYLRVKGEVERELAALGFGRLDVMRPGLLLGSRNESRPGERFAQMLAPVINPLLLGSLRRYRAIAAADVAAAIVGLVRQSGSGHAIHEWQEIQSGSRSSAAETRR